MVEKLAPNQERTTQGEYTCSLTPTRRPQDQQLAGEKTGKRAQESQGRSKHLCTFSQLS